MVSLFLCVVVLSAAFSETEFPGNSEYIVKYFSEPVDHINRSPGIFNVKVLLRQGHHDAPLFVYTGNEGPIESFFLMAGWLVDYLGPKYNATVAFIEHRYYGESKITPFTWEFLDTTQVLWDYADIVWQLKPKKHTAVIAFGGSYGGMLSAMFRIKYPHLVDGAIASSAPLLMSSQNSSAFNHKLKEIYATGDPLCASHIWEGFEVLSEMRNRELYYSALDKMFPTCGGIKDSGDVGALQNYISGAIEGIAQFAYPYPADVFGPLPSHPVSTTCSFIARYNDPRARSIWSTLRGFSEVLGLYYNGTGNVECFDINAAPGSVSHTWHYQTCSELVMPIGQSGWPNDMFNAMPYNSAMFAKECKMTFGVEPRADLIQQLYGMRQNYTSSLQSLSNIVFSYGTEDPWSVGCFKEQFESEKDVLVIGIHGAAHHYDLRAPNRLDSQAVRSARSKEEKLIVKWVSAKAT